MPSIGMRRAMRFTLKITLDVYLSAGNRIPNFVLSIAGVQTLAIYAGGRGGMGGLRCGGWRENGGSQCIRPEIRRGTKLSRTIRESSWSVDGEASVVTGYAFLLSNGEIRFRSFPHLSIFTSVLRQRHYLLQ
jgi:hypothetical protein